MQSTLKVLDQTADHCDTIATLHYVQAESSKLNRIWFGVPSMLINLLIGSILVADLSKELPNYVKWGTAILALISSFLVGIQTFFAFEKTEKGHRELGNKFNKTSRALAALKARFEDKLLSDADFASQFASLMEEYEVVCKENEETPPSRSIAKKLRAETEDN